MKKDKPIIFKRILAYLVDICIVSLISSVITVAFPSNELYNTKLKELADVRTKYQNKEIDDTEFNSMYSDISYDLSHNSIDTSIVILAISILYFVGYNYYSNGQTFGKRLMKIRITSANGKKLRINNYLIRSLLVNSVLSSLISIILLLFLSKSNYILYDSKISVIFSIIYVLCFVLILYRSDNRGLHDLASNTKVISDLKDVVIASDKVIDGTDLVVSEDSNETRDVKKKK